MKKKVPSDKYAVEVSGLRKTYHDGVDVEVLMGMDFKIREGEFVAIIGPSGSGKSTLLNILSALDLPSSGRVLIGGHDIGQMSNYELANLRNREIGFVFQSFNLINTMTAIENVELPLIVTGLPKEERHRRAAELLNSFGIERKNVLPLKLSGGQQQRVAIARALITDPEIVLGDEPTGDLNTEDTTMIMKIFRRLNEETGKTLVIVTHNPDVANQAERIISLRDGRIVSIKQGKNSKLKW
jgi:putative ABC transport system ATP-binding protein